MVDAGCPPLELQKQGNQWVYGAYGSRVQLPSLRPDLSPRLLVDCLTSMRTVPLVTALRRVPLKILAVAKERLLVLDVGGLSFALC
jgi:hypothetical protein